MKELKFVNSVDKFIEVWKDIDDEVRFRLLKKVQNNLKYPKFNIKVTNNEIYLVLENGTILNFDGNIEDKKEALIITLIKALGIQNINKKG